jgi:CDP-diacylglycerol--glycerol-3-phosphate 3-phosphatidyltransferase
MLTLYQAKPAFQNCLRPLVQQLAAWNITPNQITVSAIGLSILSGLTIATFPQSSFALLTLPGVLLGRMGLNAIDGMLAREHGLTTPLGCLLNELGDVVSDMVLYLPFCLIPGVQAAWIVGVVILAMLTELVGVLGLAIADQRGYSGPMGKSDRVFIFGAIGLALGLGVAPGTWLTMILVAVCGLELWTVVNRMRATLKEVSPCN